MRMFADAETEEANSKKKAESRKKRLEKTLGNHKQALISSRRYPVDHP
jgi:hypothetical protein